PKTTLESNICWCPLGSDIRKRTRRDRMRMSEPDTRSNDLRFGARSAYVAYIWPLVAIGQRAHGASERTKTCSARDVRRSRPDGVEERHCAHGGSRHRLFRGGAA